MDLNSLEGSAESLRDHRLAVEYESLKKYSPLGVYVLPQIASMRVWHGVIFLRQGLYKGGVFRFKIEIPVDYPNSAPSVFFHTYVYHPLVHPETGELSLAPQFTRWRPNKDYVFCILGYVKKIFYSTELWTDRKDAFNLQALNAFIEYREEFEQDARRCVIASEYCEEDNNDKNPIKFLKFNAFHKKVLEMFKASFGENQHPGSEEYFIRWFKQTFT